MYDIIIKNGYIVDYDLDKFTLKDIGIKDHKIAAIDENLSYGQKIIDAKNKIVSPGFIDIHMHEEKIDTKSDNDFYDIGNKMLHMGVTTCVGGNCGTNRMEVEDFFQFVDKYKSPVNYMLFVGYNHHRNKIGVNKYKKATKSQIEKIKKSIKNDIVKNKAIGLSFGIEYSPGISFEEIIEVCDYIKDLDVLLSAHFRADGKKGIDAVKEMIYISELTKLPMQISHLNSCTATGQMRKSLDIIKEAIDKQVDVRADCYPYTAFCTKIGSAVFDDETCFENWNIGYDAVLVTEGPYKGARCTRKLFNKIRKKYPNTYIVVFNMNEDEIIEALKEPFVYPASDGVLTKGHGHPRAAGTFPRIIGNYVRDKKKLDLIDQLEKMSKLPAKRLGLDQKGEIKIGMDADIVVFDYDKIKDQATFENPTTPPTGIDYVLIDGEIALEKGKKINKRLGKSIRKNVR